LEGYAPFPSPLSSPLRNEKGISKKGKLLLQNEMKKVFKKEKNLSMIKMKDNRGLSYLTSEISPSSDRDKSKLYILINNQMKLLKHQYKYKPYLFEKSKEVTAMRRFRWLLKSNKGSEIIHGRSLDRPASEVEQKFKIIDHGIKRSGIKERKRKEALNELVNRVADDLSFCRILR
jgi:hypothetical protein